MDTEPDAVEVEQATFPWGRAVLVLATLWATLWGAGVVDGMAGAYVYDDRSVPEAPYTEKQLAMIEHVAPETFALANMDMDSWRATVVLGRTIARLEGKVIGSLLLLGVWGSLGVMWLWNRLRDRRSQLLFSADFS